MNRNLRNAMLTNNFMASYLAVEGMRRHSKKNSSASSSGSSYVTGSARKKNIVYTGALTSEESLPKLDYEVVETIDPTTKFSQENLAKISPETAQFVEKLQKLFTAEIDKEYIEREKKFLKLQSVKEDYDKVYALGLSPYFTGKYDSPEKKKAELAAGVEFTKADIEAGKNLFKEKIEELSKEYPDWEAKRKEYHDLSLKYLKYGKLLDLFKKLEKKYYDAKNKYNLYDSIGRSLAELKKYSDIYEKLTPEDREILIQAFKDFEELGLTSGDVDNELRSSRHEVSRLFNCRISSEDVQQCIQEAEKKVLESLSPEDKEKYANIGKIIAEAFNSKSYQILSELPTRTKDLNEDTNKNTYLQDVIYLVAIEEFEKIKESEKAFQTQKTQADKNSQTTQKSTGEQGYTF